MIANFIGIDIKSGIGSASFWLTTSCSISLVHTEIWNHLQNVSALMNHIWLQQYTHETDSVLLFEFDIRIKSYIFRLANELWTSSMESSKCANKNIARISSLKVKSAAKPHAKSALCIEKRENDPGIIRWHMICWSKGTVCVSLIVTVLYFCVLHISITVKIISQKGK